MAEIQMEYFYSVTLPEHSSLHSYLLTNAICFGMG